MAEMLMEFHITLQGDFWLFQKHFVPLRAALLKHPDEALMDDIGEMWSLECSPKYYVDCWMNMMQKFYLKFCPNIQNSLK